MKNRKRIRIILILLGALVAAFLVFAISLGVYFDQMLEAANSINQLEDRLYSMSFEGDYGFDQFMEKGGARSDNEVAAFLTDYLTHGLVHSSDDLDVSSVFGCSTIVRKNESNGTVFFGRNFDWTESRTIIVHTEPDHGYASVSTSNIEFLGIPKDCEPDGDIMTRMACLAAIYVPLDGMNEEGLVVADLMAGDTERTAQDTGKVDLTTTTAIRYLLDHAATVEEALQLLEQIDMNSSAVFAHHIAIADKNGNSVVVEYIANEMHVTETKVVTNHYLTEGKKEGVGSDSSHLRYEILDTYDGEVNEDAFSQLMKSVSQGKCELSDEDTPVTLWTIVYDTNEVEARFFYEENFDHYYSLELASPIWWIFR